jgi:hypothetical protein
LLLQVVVVVVAPDIQAAETMLWVVAVVLAVI